MIAVRAVRAGEQAPLRELRLRALADAPPAFASTAEQEAEHPDSHWSKLAHDSAEADTMIVCVAIDGDRWVGMAGGRWFDRERGVAQLWGMWVDPAWRGQAVGDRLVDAIRCWASGLGARFVRLGVIGEDARAASFYERLGFVRTGEVRPLIRQPELTAVFLARPA